MSSEDRFVALRISREELDALIPLICACRYEQLTPLGSVALRIVAASITEPGTCMVCDCTDDDCSGTSN
ncbi:MAG: hypothetical protein QOE70_4356 [Chthoniobacter sp.]|nr:hypothetical protein [Chthoniobacter sp.]